MIIKIMKHKIRLLFSVFFLLSIAVMFISAIDTKKEEKMSNSNNVGDTTIFNEELIKTMYNDKVKIYKIKRNDNYAGYSIWLYRTGKNIKAKYFAYSQNGKSIYQRYNKWKKGKKIILYTHGTYTSQNYKVPNGFTIDAGNLVNRNIDNKLDGLIIVEAGGSVRVADLEKTSSQCIYLVSINQSLNPRNSSKEKNKFINWARDENATVFQTNLMYFKNEKKFRNVSETANRRIFVLGIDNGQVVHILFTIEQSVSLTNISEEIYKYLMKIKGFRPIGILYLDPHYSDIFRVFNENGTENSNIRGSTSVSDAKNLMVYYYDN